MGSAWPFLAGINRNIPIKPFKQHISLLTCMYLAAINVAFTSGISVRWARKNMFLFLKAIESDCFGTCVKTVDVDGAETRGSQPFYLHFESLFKPELCTNACTSFLKSSNLLPF